MSIFSFFSSLLGFGRSDSDSQSDVIVSACPSCGDDLTVCTCCYICGDSSRYSCACSAALADAATDELLRDVDREESL